MLSFRRRLPLRLLEGGLLLPLQPANHRCLRRSLILRLLPLSLNSLPLFILCFLPLLLRRFPLDLVIRRTGPALFASSSHSTISRFCKPAIPSDGNVGDSRNFGRRPMTFDILLVTVAPLIDFGESSVWYEDDRSLGRDSPFGSSHFRNEKCGRIQSA